MGLKAEKIKEEVLPVVIYMTDLHCNGCASKIKRCAKGFQGVEGVTVDMATMQLRVTGNMNPWTLRDHMAVNTHKTFDIISPVKPLIDCSDKKLDAGAAAAVVVRDAAAVVVRDAASAAAAAAAAAATAATAAAVAIAEAAAAASAAEAAAAAAAKAAAAVAAAAAGDDSKEIRLRCNCCNHRIMEIALKVKGVQAASLDEEKDLVIVKGTMNGNSLIGYLKEKLNHEVKIL